MRLQDVEAIEVTKTDFLRGLNEMVRQGQLTAAEAAKKQVETVVAIQKCALAKYHGLKTMPSNSELQRLRRKKQQDDVKVLRANMADAGREVKEGYDAHHIVASNDFRPYAAIWVDRAQAILRRWCIDINHEANGVALPRSEAFKQKMCPDTNCPSHKKVHTRKYYMNIANDIQGAGSREECVELLREIGEDLESGSYGW